LPPNFNPDGKGCILLEQENESEKKKGKKYKLLSYVGLFLLGFSFVLQIISLIIK